MIAGAHTRKHTEYSYSGVFDMRSITLRSEYQANKELAVRSLGYQGFTYTRVLRQTRKQGFFRQFMWWL